MENNRKKGSVFMAAVVGTVVGAVGAALAHKNTRTKAKAKFNHYSAVLRKKWDELMSEASIGKEKGKKTISEELDRTAKKIRESEKK